jgi:hypothetical protein
LSLDEFFLRIFRPIRSIKYSSFADHPLLFPDPGHNEAGQIRRGQIGKSGPSRRPPRFSHNSLQSFSWKNPMAWQNICIAGRSIVQRRSPAAVQSQLRTGTASVPSQQTAKAPSSPKLGLGIKSKSSNGRCSKSKDFQSQLETGFAFKICVYQCKSVAEKSSSMLPCVLVVKNMLSVPIPT